MSLNKMALVERISDLHEDESEIPKYFGDKPPSTKTAIERAKKEGLKVVYPGPHDLQIDVDSEANLKTFWEHHAILQKWLDTKAIHIEKSLSGDPGHFHVTVISATRYFSAQDRLLLQALLGSDLKREILGFVMLKSG